MAEHTANSVAGAPQWESAPVRLGLICASRFSTPMHLAKISEAQPFSMVFANIAPKQCNIRIYEWKTGTWAEFHHK